VGSHWDFIPTKFRPFRPFRSDSARIRSECVGECQVLAIDDKLATTLTTLDTSKGIPILDVSTLSPARPATIGRIRNKFSQAMTTMTHGRVLLSAPRRLSATRACPLLNNDKICVMPGVWWFKGLMDVIRMCSFFNIFGLSQKRHDQVQISYLVWQFKL
jgi:hypothetical protein